MKVLQAATLLLRAKLKYVLAILVVLLIAVVIACLVLVAQSYQHLHESTEVYIELQAKYQKLLETARLLNSSLEAVVGMLRKYCCIPEVLPYVLSKDEVLSLKWYMVLAGVDLQDELASIEHVYNWVVSNIDYSLDPIVPMPRHNATCIILGNESYCYYEFREIRDYVQSPLLTILRRSGDCEDHAVLVYAMLTYYFRYLQGRNYTLWIAVLELVDGSRHAAVFIPVYGGRLIIVDTSKHYLSNTSAVLEKSALQELEDYSYYFLENAGIKLIVLYSVDVERGVVLLDASGGIATIASYISEYASKPGAPVLNITSAQ